MSAEDVASSADMVLVSLPTPPSCSQCASTAFSRAAV